MYVQCIGWVDSVVKYVFLCDGTVHHFTVNSEHLNLSACVFSARSRRTGVRKDREPLWPAPLQRCMKDCMPHSHSPLWIAGPSSNRTPPVRQGHGAPNLPCRPLRVFLALGDAEKQTAKELLRIKVAPSSHVKQGNTRTRGEMRRHVGMSLLN